MSRFSLSWPCWLPFSSAPSPRSKHRGRTPRARFGTAGKATGWVCEAGGYEAPLWSPKWPWRRSVVRRRLNAPQLPVSESRESGISDRAFADHENCASGRHLSETRTNPCLSRPGYGTAPDTPGRSIRRRSFNAAAQWRIGLGHFSDRGGREGGLAESLGRRLAADYFETLHIPLLRGREFTPADEKNQSTMIIN